MDRQDEALEEILGGVVQLKGHARGIGEEAEDQTRMLDEIGIATERAEDALAREAERTKRIQEDTSLCRYYIAIIVLLVVLILLLVLSI